ncbi:hypothetical protein FS749_006704 [Ceratobasidium sp. UAMH 11750]|nr:hypothetical protein FS749_006704 [Ceratobasidium sp. UAMH 11750]
MASPVPDGIYSISLPFNGGAITDPGEGRYLLLLKPDSLGPHAHKIKVVYKHEKGAYTLQFEHSKEYLTWDGVPSQNNKLLTGDKPRYFKITQHHYETDKFVISTAEDKFFHVGVALERIFPPWVALSNFPEKQAWAFEGIY